MSYAVENRVVLWKTFFKKFRKKIFSHNPTYFLFFSVRSAEVSKIFIKNCTMNGDFTVFKTRHTIHYEWRFLKILRIINEN